MNRNHKHRLKNWPGQITPKYIKIIWKYADLCGCDAETLRGGCRKYFFANNLREITTRDAKQLILYLEDVIKEKAEGTFQGSLS